MGMIRSSFKQSKPKQKTCKVCKGRFEPRSAMAVACSTACAVGHAAALREKKDRTDKAIDRRNDAKRKEALKSRSDWLKEAQIAFNAFIRYRDMIAGHACISSGRPLDWNGNAVDAGHYRSTGSAPHLRFNENNCHAQSKHDNRYLSGNVVDYRIGLIARIGVEAVESLESDNAPCKYTIDELKAIKQEYKDKLKELKNGHSDS